MTHRPSDQVIAQNHFARTSAGAEQTDLAFRLQNFRVSNKGNRHPLYIQALNTWGCRCYSSSFIFGTLSPPTFAELTTQRFKGFHKVCFRVGRAARGITQAAVP